MYTALYYPHISIGNVNLLKTALLLWDKLEYIVPDQFTRASSAERGVKEALEIIALPHLPTDEEKQMAHNQIMELTQSELPEWFFFDPINTELIYQIYPEKFLPNTWRSLEEISLAKPSGFQEPEQYLTSESFGLTMMSILAECCAGTQKRTVTDEIDSYAALTRYITAAHDGQYGVVSEEYERLVTISLKVIDVNGIDIQRLIDLRAREITKNDYFLRNLRHKYLKAIDLYVKRLTQEAQHEGDKIEIERLFEQEMGDDLSELNERLGSEVKKVIFSNVFTTALISMAGLAPEPITLAGGLLGVGALIGQKVMYSAARKKTLKDHAMSWLYTAKYKHPLL